MTGSERGSGVTAFLFAVAFLVVAFAIASAPYRQRGDGCTMTRNMFRVNTIHGENGKNFLSGA